MNTTRYAEDEVLVQLTREQLAGDPGTQLIAEMYGKLRSMDLAWWSPARLREYWPARDRMGWFADRPDVRQRLTIQLTGLAPRAARALKPAAQAELIDSVIESGDVTVHEFEIAFEPSEMAIHAPSGELWREFRERMPWEERTPEHKQVAAWLLGALLADRGDVASEKRQSLLTPLYLRSAIDSRAWQEHLPLEIRAAVDSARLRREWESPGKAFEARQELELVTIERLVEFLPLVELKGVLDAAERALRALGVHDANPQGVVVQTDRPAPNRSPLGAPPRTPERS
jgi:hypothetical protein